LPACQYKYESESPRIRFECNEPTITNGKFCFFHDEDHYDEYEEDAANRFEEKLLESISENKSLLCIGYYLPNINFLQLLGEESLPQRAYFTKVTFYKGASFAFATSSEELEFTNATFSGPAIFTKATFGGAADFHTSTFSEPASFTFATFSETADFTNATFTGAADFSEAAFSKATFIRTKFLESVVFFRQCSKKGHSSRMLHSPTKQNSCQLDSKTTLIF
jgi:hypothetical protein